MVDQDATNCMLLLEICQAGAWEVAGCAHQPDRILRKPVARHVLMELLDGISGRIEGIRIRAV